MWTNVLKFVLFDLNMDGAVRDCQVSEWGSWSECDVTCGPGSQSRTRHVTSEAHHGGKSCPAVLQKRGCQGTQCGARSSHKAAFKGYSQHQSISRSFFTPFIAELFPIYTWLYPVGRFIPDLVLILAYLNCWNIHLMYVTSASNWYGQKPSRINEWLMNTQMASRWWNSLSTLFCRREQRLKQELWTVAIANSFVLFCINSSPIISYLDTTIGTIDF